MRKWQNLAAPDDPNSWSDLDGFWPTPRGTYETVDFLTGTDITASSASAPVYAFAGKTVSAVTPLVEYVVDSAHIWSYSGGALTNVTNSVAISSNPQMTQFGNVTIAVFGNAAVTSKNSLGGNFSALAGAPKATYVCVQSNVVLAFNTDTSPDGWAASDVGDHTNWTTGEAASGRIFQEPGPITGAVPFGNDVIVFKANSIYRMTYVGGLVKWSVSLLWVGQGNQSNFTPCAGSSGILFQGTTGDNNYPFYFFDGANAPRLANPLTQIAAPSGFAIYNPVNDVFSITLFSTLTSYYYYSPSQDMWGFSSAAIGVGSAQPVQGDLMARSAGEISSSIPAYAQVTTNKMKRFVSAGGATGTPGVCYIQSSKDGKVDRKTTWQGLTPLLRRRTDLSGSSIACSATFFHEREDTSPATTIALTESTYRKRFDITAQGSTDTFAKFKVTWTNYDVEIDDFLPKSVDAGEN